MARELVGPSARRSAPGAPRVARLFDHPVDIVAVDVGDRSLTPALGETLRNQTELAIFVGAKPQQARGLAPASRLELRVLLDEVYGGTGERIGREAPAIRLGALSCRDHVAALGAPVLDRERESPRCAQRQRRSDHRFSGRRRLLRREVNATERELALPAVGAAEAHRPALHSAWLDDEVEPLAGAVEHLAPLRVCLQPGYAGGRQRLCHAGHWGLTGVNKLARYSALCGVSKMP